MKEKILKYILVWQGFYYGLTGIWAIVSLESFSLITRHPVHDAFDMHSIAALAVVLGIMFVWGAYDVRYRFFAAVLALLSAVAIVIPELVYFSEIKGTLFVPDLFEEILIAVLLAIGLYLKRKNA